jgi:hypothetical protein
MNIPTTRNSTASRIRKWSRAIVSAKDCGDRKRRVELLVRNNLAFDLKHSASEVWLVGPKVRNLDRNNHHSARVRRTFLQWDCQCLAVSDGNRDVSPGAGTVQTWDLLSISRETLPTENDRTIDQ